VAQLMGPPDAGQGELCAGIGFLNEELNENPNAEPRDPKSERWNWPCLLERCRGRPLAAFGFRANILKN
jgi:hypothetical protein